MSILGILKAKINMRNVNEAKKCDKEVWIRKSEESVKDSMTDRFDKDSVSLYCDDGPKCGCFGRKCIGNCGKKESRFV